MADNRSESAESAASTINETLAPGSVARPGGGGSSEWDPALQLAAGDGGSSSSTFRLPALADHALHTAGGQTQFPAGQLELWEFAENFPNNESTIGLPEEIDTTSNNSFEDALGVHYRHYHPLPRLSWTNSDAITPHNSPSRLETNSPSPTTLPHEQLHNNVADATLPPFQTHDVADATWNPSLPAPASQQTWSPSGFGSLTNDQPLVPHANVIAMPTIGNVQGFIRTPGSFQSVAGETLAQEPSGFLAPLPAPPLLQPPTATDSSAPFRYPRIHQLGAGTGMNHNHASQAQQPWPRSNATVRHQRPDRSIDRSISMFCFFLFPVLAISLLVMHVRPVVCVQAEYANAIWSRAEQLRAPDLAPDCRVSDPRQSDIFKRYRPWTQGLTNPLTPAQRPAARNPAPPQRSAASHAVDPAVNTNGKRQRARRSAAADPQSVYARVRIILSTIYELAYNLASLAMEFRCFSTLTSSILFLNSERICKGFQKFLAPLIFISVCMGGTSWAMFAMYSDCGGLVYLIFGMYLIFAECEIIEVCRPREGEGCHEISE
jgi:hypothetical protein